MTRYGPLIAFAVFSGLSGSGGAADFSYSYLELAADLSRTENTATAPLENDADGRSFGIGGSWEVSDSVYVKYAWSRETKEFVNEVALTPVDLNSEQSAIALSGGYHWDAGERTGIYTEALAIVDFAVEHLIPVVVPSRSGPPTVSTVESSIEGYGFSAALGMRHWIRDGLEVEVQLSRTHTRADVLRTEAEISDSETMLRVGGHVYPDDGLSVGAFFSYSRHTDDNFDNIRKLGISLRFHF
ncbi:MAG: hypothetical protein F4128_03620, partial [Gammaproteobacteria bacterium]|nr:hypothetical protein [Gammaproteobacteria bacterium]